MSTFAASRKVITASPILAAAIYIGFVAVLLFIVVTSIMDVVGQQERGICGVGHAGTT